MSPAGYWPGPWPGEDGGPSRQLLPSLPFTGPAAGASLAVTSRMALASTMVVLREPGEVYLLCHTGGDDAISWVEQVDPLTLETVRRSPDLPGGPTWPGGIACHTNGSLYVVFGCHAHRLSPSLDVVVTVELPRRRPYNSFVILPDGHLALKDFGGLRAGAIEPDSWGASELLVLEPETLEIADRCTLPEPSIARLSADGNDIYVVGDTSLQRVRWNGRTLTFDDEFHAVYRTIDGQTYGWDAVIADGAAWFLDNGEGSNRFAGTFRGMGLNTAPLHLVRVDLASGAVSLTEICGLPGGLIANPPAIDPERRIAVGYDSGNGVVAAFRYGDTGATTPLWRRDMNHAAHPLRCSDGALVLCDHDATRNADQVVIVDLETGAEIARADTGSPIQSVLFLAPGFDRDFYYCSFTTLARISF
ncbi:MAG: hypothetical protein WCC60_09820 [Ilumatobacteraceae bacterium]